METPVLAAARLIRKGINSVAVIEPQQVHTHRPLLSYVGGGQASLSSAQRTQRSVTPHGCTWIEDSVTVVDAAERIVTCASGRRYRYRDLVLGPGLVPDVDALPGIYSALDSPAVASNYLDRAEKTWALIEAMPVAGHRHDAQTLVPRGSSRPLTGNGPAGWTASRSPSSSITHNFQGFQNWMIGCSAACETSASGYWQARPSRRWNRKNAESPVTDVDCNAEHLQCDFLHLVPPFRGPPWLQSSDLIGDNEHGLVDIDPLTFAHRVHAGVWAVGDGAAVQTDPSGGALGQQVSILVDNILAARAGTELSSYDGYTVAPVTIDAHRLIAGEFDRTGAVSSSLPSFLDPLAPRRTAWAFDRYVLPRVYWNSILKGRL